MEYDNNGNGNRELMQYSTDGGLTWFRRRTRTRTRLLPGNGNTGDVTGETTLTCPATSRLLGGGANAASAGDTNIKVASVANIGTTLAAASSAGDTNIKVAASRRSSRRRRWPRRRTRATRTSRSPASQNLVPGESLNIDSGAALETARRSPSVGTAGATGTGVTLTAGLASAHASGAPVTVAGQQINIDTGAGHGDATVSTSAPPAPPARA